jgi:scyllo-inositol 2-dehydrogenase (NAD+)
MASFSGAVVGCGRMGGVTSEIMRRFAPKFWLPLSHCEAMQAHAEITLDAVCDVDAGALQAARSRFNVPNAYQDYRRMIDEIAPQILGIATRTPQRPDIIRHAVQRGVRALHIEKPLCNSMQQLLELERLLSSGEIACTYGTLRRYLPMFDRARVLAQSGSFGELQHVQVCFGRAPLLWTHPHAVDLLLFMAGDVAVARVAGRFAGSSVACTGSTIDGDPRVLSLVVEFVNGTTGLISESGGWDVVLSCSAGSVTVESDGHRIRCRGSCDPDPYWCDKTPDAVAGDGTVSEYGGTALALERLVSVLKQQQPLKNAVSDKRAIFAGQRVLFAAAQSHLQGGIAIDPAVLDPDLVISGRTGDRYA